MTLRICLERFSLMMKMVCVMSRQNCDSRDLWSNRGGEILPVGWLPTCDIGIASANMAMKIAILEDNLDRQAAMRACLADRFYMYDAKFFDEAAQMIEFLKLHLAQTILISLDHDLEMKPGNNGRYIDPGTGRDVADFLATMTPTCPVVIHTTNSSAAEGMKLVLQDSGWSLRRVIPFDDLNWISTDWFRTVRRAIVGPVRRQTPARSVSP